MKRTLIIASALLMFVCAGCAKELPSPSAPPEPTLAPNTPGSLTITFDFERQSGVASNQYAVWIEDTDGNMVRTLYATNYTASGGYKKRPDSIALWVERAMGKVDFDAVAGATPQSGPVAYTMDCTDILPGTYYFYVEGTLRWKNYVLYTGEIEVGGESAGVEALAECADATAKERGMVTNVKATYTM